jgi:hypothetical protein
MNWQEAKESTLRLWQSIYDSVGTADPVQLLTEINAIGDLCSLAKEEAETQHELAKCNYCPAFQQFGGCREVSGILSELVAERKWEELRANIRQFMRQLERMEAPGALEPTVH